MYDGMHAYSTVYNRYTSLENVKRSSCTKMLGCFSYNQKRCFHTINVELYCDKRTFFQIITCTRQKVYYLLPHKGEIHNTQSAVRLL